MPVPQDGMTVQEAEQLQLTAAKTVYGDYYLDDTMVKISVNGAPARVMISGPYFPSFSCVLTVPGGKGGNLKKESLYGDYNANKKNIVQAITFILRKQPMPAALTCIRTMWSPLQPLVTV